MRRTVSFFVSFFMRIKDFDSNWFDLLALKAVDKYKCARIKSVFSAKCINRIILCFIRPILHCVKHGLWKNGNHPTHSIRIDSLSLSPSLASIYAFIRWQYIGCYFDFIRILCVADGWIMPTITNLISFFRPLFYFYSSSFTIFTRFSWIFAAIWFYSLLNFVGFCTRSNGNW